MHAAVQEIIHVYYRPLQSGFGLTTSAIRTRSARVRASIFRIAAPR